MSYNNKLKFFGRYSELGKLQEIKSLAEEKAQLTCVFGKRGVGKTSLILNAFNNESYLYFYVEKKNEQLICKEYSRLTKEFFNDTNLQEFNDLPSLFRYLVERAENELITVVIDNFHNLKAVRPSINQELTTLWKTKSEDSKLNLIFCGFEELDPSLTAVSNHQITIKPFTIHELRELLRAQFPHYTKKDLLGFYVITGGVANHVKYLVSQKAFTETQILNTVIGVHSLLLEQGKNGLTEYLGKDYGNYFSILSLISLGHTARPEIEAILGMQTGGFLDRLENEYRIVRKVRPILAKPDGRLVKYEIEDNYLNFWFRFIYPNISLVKGRQFEELKNRIRREYAEYSELILTRYFTEQIALKREYSLMGTHWEKGGERKIDIVGINRKEKKALFVEVKRKEEDLDLTKLKTKSRALLGSLKGYKATYLGLSLEDVV